MLDVGDLVKHFNETQELYGVITRFGSIQGGHSTYYVHWFSNNEWSNESDWLEWEYEIKRI
jgi:ubiquitin C-terminal hydrolase